jgi:hypothetical protein
LPIWRLMDSHTWCHPKCHVCSCLKKWAWCMERVVVHLYVRNFITNQSLHDLRRHVFVAMWWLLIWRERRWFRMSLVDQQMQLRNLTPLLRSRNVKGFMRGTTLFRWPWRCMMHSSMIWIVSLGSVPVFSIEKSFILVFLHSNF